MGSATAAGQVVEEQRGELIRTLAEARRCLGAHPPAVILVKGRRAGSPAFVATYNCADHRSEPHSRLEQLVRLWTTHVVLAAAHLDHDPTNNRLRNLRCLCQRCHMIHDRPHHLAQRQITYYLLRRALGDLFFGPYGNRWSWFLSRVTTPAWPPRRQPPHSTRHPIPDKRRTARQALRDAHRRPRRWGPVRSRCIGR